MFRTAVAALPLLVACSAPQQQPQQQPLAPQEPRPMAPVSAATVAPQEASQRVVSRKHGVSLLVPARDGWRKDERADWLVLEDARGLSFLRLRVASGPRLVGPDDCLAEARLRYPALPVLEEEEIVDRRKLSAPAGFDGELVAAVRAEGSALRGYVIAHGAALGRCYAAAFESSSTGPEREAEIGSRLRAAVEALESVEVLRIEDRAR